MITTRVRSTNERYPASLMILILIVVVGVFVRIAHWNPGLVSDDSRYMNFAATLASGSELDTVDSAAIRLAFVGFLAFGMRVFGAITAVASSLGLVVYVALSTVLFFLAKYLSHERAALLAVGIFAFLPVDIYYSTVVLPDALMTTFCLGSVLAYLVAGGEPQPGWRKRGFLFLAGILLGCAMSAKEPAFCLGLAYAIHLLIVKRSLKRTLLGLTPVALGAISLFALESFGFWLWTGDPFFRLHVMNQAYGTGSSWEHAFSVREVAYYAITATDTWELFGVHGFLVAAAAILSLNNRSRDLVFPWIFFTVFLVYLSIGSASLTRYVLVPNQPRYLLPAMVMGCVVVAAEFTRLQARVKLRAVPRILAGLGLVLVSLWATKEANVSNIPAVVHWMEDLGESQRSQIVVSESFVGRQALENRAFVQNLKTMVVDETMSDSVKAELLGNGALLAAGMGWDAEIRELGVRLAEKEEGSYRIEEIHAPSWPPYKEFLGVGQEFLVSGYIWWPIQDSVVR